MSDAGRARTYAPGVMWPAADDARSPLVEILSVLSSSFDPFLLAFASRLQVFRGFREGLLKILRGNNPLQFELQHYRQANRDSNSSSDQRFEEDWIGKWLIKSFTQNIDQVFLSFYIFSVISELFPLQWRESGEREFSQIPLTTHSFRDLIIELNPFLTNIL